MDDVSFTVASGTAVALAGAGGSGRPGQNFPGMSALAAHGMVRELLETAGLIPPARLAATLPRQLSGAQCQPVVTAAALACDAGLIIPREPVLMPDVSPRAARRSSLSPPARRLPQRLRDAAANPLRHGWRAPRPYDIRRLYRHEAGVPHESRQMVLVREDDAVGRWSGCPRDGAAVAAGTSGGCDGGRTSELGRWLPGAH